MSPEEAEHLAIPFGLTYLSREGYVKLAMLLTWFSEQESKLQEPSKEKEDLRKYEG